MKWLEMITLQVAGKNREIVQRKLAELMNDMDSNSGVKKADLYRHAMTGNDVSIHLHWESEKVSPQGSALGICLRSALAPYGLLSHEVWMDDGKKTRNSK
jgi:hypothetical protein